MIIKCPKCKTLISKGVTKQAEDEKEIVNSLQNKGWIRASEIAKNPKLNNQKEHIYKLIRNLANQKIIKERWRKRNKEIRLA